MLKKLRNKKTAKKIWIVLAAIIVPAFVLWGSGSLIRSKNEPTYAGKIFGKNIPFTEFRDAISAVRNQAIMQFGDNYSEIEKYLNLEQQAWDRLILLQEAKKCRIKVSDKEVIELLEKYPIFKRRGQFDNKIYTEILQYVFHTQPRLFEEQTRQNLMLAKLYDQVTKDINVSPEEIRKEYEKQNQELSVNYIAALSADFSKEITPSEEQLKDYFSKNSLQFKQPVSFNMEYVRLDSPDKVNDLLLRLKRKNDFSGMTKEMGLTIKETGLFSQRDPIPGIGWSPEILNMISKLGVGEVSTPIQMDKDYLIFRLKEKKEPYIPEFKDIGGKVKDEYIKAESEKLAKTKIDECLKNLQENFKENPGKADLEKCAKDYGLKYSITENFKYGSYIEGIGASDNLWLKAKELKQDEFSGVIDIPSGFYIIKLKAIVPIDEKKFESEKKEFADKLLAQKKQVYFAKFVEELKRQAKTAS